MTPAQIEESNALAEIFCEIFLQLSSEEQAVYAVGVSDCHPCPDSVTNRDVDCPRVAAQV